MSMLPDPEPNRGATQARRGRALLACAGVALGLAALSTSSMAHAQGQPPPPPPVGAPAAAPAAAPAPAPAPAAAPAAMPPAPPPPPPGATGQPVPNAQGGYGYPQPQQGYGYPPQGYGYPPQGYGYAPPQGDPGQTQPGYGAPPQGYPYGYPYYPYGQPAAPMQRYERKSSGMMTGGIVLTTAGIIGVLVGSSLASTAANQIPIYCEPVGGGGPTICEYRDDSTQLAAGLGVMITGFVALGVGIPLWVIGGKRVPVKDPNAAPDAPSAPAAPQTSMRLFVSPTGASVRVSF